MSQSLPGRFTPQALTALRVFLTLNIRDSDLQRLFATWLRGEAEFFGMPQDSETGFRMFRTLWDFHGIDTEAALCLYRAHMR